MVDELRLADAARAFADANRRSEEIGDGRSSPPLGVGAVQGEDQSFSGFLRESLETAVETGERAEKMQMAHIFGKVELPELITAVNEAEATLRTVTSIRTQIIRAYQEIIKLPI